MNLIDAKIISILKREEIKLPNQKIIYKFTVEYVDMSCKSNQTKITNLYKYSKYDECKIGEIFQH